MNVLAAALALALLAPPAAGERIGVLAVHEPGPADLDLVELTHQLRAACTERVPGVLQAPEMRARLQGRTGNATAAELDRAFNGALAVYQNGEYESAERTLKAIVADLEQLPEGEAVWRQWTRAMMRLSHVQFTQGQRDDADATQLAVLKVDPSHQLDPVLYAPGYRAHFDELRARVRAMPKRRLTVTARGRDGTIYVGGRDVGLSPVTVIVPAGTYRVAGAAGELRPPPVTVDLADEDRAVTLDFALAEAVRIASGPALALPPGDRAATLVKAGAWLGVDRLVATSRLVEGEAPFLVGAVYDVRRGALMREGSVRVVGGAVPPASLGALAAFLLTGTPSREVNDRVRLAARAPVPVARAASPAARAVPPAAVAVAATATPPAALPPAAPRPAPGAPTAATTTAATTHGRGRLARAGARARRAARPRSHRPPAAGRSAGRGGERAAGRGPRRQAAPGLAEARGHRRHRPRRRPRRPLRPAGPGRPQRLRRRRRHGAPGRRAGAGRDPGRPRRRHRPG